METSSSCTYTSAVLTLLGLGFLATVAMFSEDIARADRISNKFLETSFDIFSFALRYRVNETVIHKTDAHLITETDLEYDRVFLLREMYPEQVCSPESFGIPEAKAAYIFPEYHYPRCRDRYTDVPGIALDLEHDSFSLVCNSSKVEKYFTGPGDLPLYASQNSIEGKILLKDLPETGPLRADDEYVIATCNNKPEVVEHWPRFKEAEYERVVANMTPTEKPLIVLMLCGDSYSRRHFYQKLSKTVEYLNEIKEDYYVEDFKLHNIMGDGTRPNIAPIFSSELRAQDVEDKDPHDNLKDYGAIWQLFKSRDFMTAIINESCDVKTHKLMGFYPELDHVSRQMFCALYEASDYTTDKNDGNTQRCIGPEMSHFWAMQYIHRFSALYPKANQWVYAHLTPAHEASGQHAETLDIDLVNFLDRYLKAYGESHEIVIFLHADHGMRFGDWKRDTAAMQETKLPAFFVIATNSLMDMIPGSREQVSLNSWRLFSKKDIRKTLRFLASYPDFTEPEPELHDGVNIFTKGISANRTCADSFIPPEFCSCMEFTQVDYTKNEELEMLANFLVSVAVSTMNLITYSSPQNIFPSFCEHVVLDNIISLEVLKSDGPDELLRVNFSLKNKKNSLVSSTFLASPVKIIGRVISKGGTKYYYDSYEEAFVFRNFHFYIKMVGMERVDKFSGPCEEAARAKDIRPDFCFCK
jgi:hypothetical protein